MSKNILIIFGVVFLLIGLLGFMQDPILGIFEVDGLHNGIHLISGILAFAFAFMNEGPRKSFAKIFAIVYALVAILGFVSNSVLGMEMNTADNFLHILLAIGFAYIGWRNESIDQSTQNSR